MTGGPETMPWDLTILIFSIPINIICIYKLNKWTQPDTTTMKITLATIISGIVIFYTVGWIWSGRLALPTRDHLGMTGMLQLGRISVSMCPGILVGTIWSYFKYELLFRKEMKEKYGKREA